MNADDDFFGAVVVKLVDQKSDIGLWILVKAAYAGSIEAIVSPLDDATNSLLIKSPTGWLHLTPFGAARSTEDTVMVWFDGLCGVYVRLTRDSALRDETNGRRYIYI